MDGLAAQLPPAILPIAVGLLALLATGGVLYALLQPFLSGTPRAARRLELIVGNPLASSATAGASPEQRRKQSIEKTLSELSKRERAKQRAKMTLRMRLNQAGLDWSTAGFWIRTVGAALVAMIVLKMLFGMMTVLAVPAGAGLGYLAVSAFIVMQRAARMRAFMAEFPNAIDVIIRGVKTGLPLGDCLKAIATEGEEPVRGEFQLLVDDIALGITLAQGLTRFTQRVPLLEANFFAVVVTIQGQLGGNLSEALGNLSRVLRERKMMKEKIKAFSAEATASGGIIASMPVAVGGILSVTSPDYIGLLYRTTTGNYVLMGCALWMLTGVMVMRRMIRFDY